MDFIGFAIKNPVKVAVGVLLLLLFGILALTRIPIQLTPDVDTPKITVTTNWTGRSPEEIEKEIIDRQEDKLKGVTNLRKMTALAQTGSSQISLEFYVGTDIDVARNEVSDKLREVPEYPDDVDQPVISSTEQGGQDAIAWLIMSSGDSNFDIQGFHDTVDERIKPIIERVEGVDELAIYGGREREVHVEINPIYMAQRGVTFNSLIGALRGENINVSAGQIEEGKNDVRIRTIGQYDNLEDISQTIVSYDATGPIRVKDIGEVKLTLAKRRAFVHQKGVNSLAMAVNKQSGANVVEVMNRLKVVIADINENVLPTYGHNITIEQVYDQTDYINDAVAMVKSNLLIGAVLAGVVLLFFLRTIRPTIVVLLAIPISVIGTFVVMTALGRTLNVISLAGLAFAVGMVVDAAIVVLENIDRHLGMGKSPFAAAYDGAKEVWGAILASVLTTVVVFIPVIFMQEEAGQLFRDISIAICAAVMLSLLVSISVIPMISARMLKTKKDKHESVIMHQAHTLLGLAPLADRITIAYSNALYWIMAKMPARFVMRTLLVALFTVLSLGGAYFLMPPSSYLPSGNNNFIFGIILNPPGYSIPYQEDMAREIEDTLRPYWEANSYDELANLPEYLDPFMGQPIENIPPIESFFDVAYPGGMIMGANSKDKQNVKPLADLLTARMFQIPGSMGFGFQMPIFGDATSSSDSVDIEIISDNLSDLKKVGAAMELAVKQEFGGFTPIQPDPMNYKLPGPELQVSIKRVNAADMGIAVSDVGTAVQSLIDGTIIGDYRLEGETIDLMLIRSPKVEFELDRITSVPLAVPNKQTGEMDTISLGSLVEVKRTQAPQQIKRIERRRAVSLSVTMPQGVALETAINKIDQMQKSILANLQKNGEIGKNVTVQIAGSADKLSSVRASLLGKWTGTFGEVLISVISSRMFLALLVTYLLMAALFESFVYPAVIMFSVPLATVGGFVGLAIVHAYDPNQQLDVLTMLGFVILIGIVVNNAILIIHQSLNYMKGLGESADDKVEQLDPHNAIRESVRTRMRPIFMTTATSVCGMLPLVIAGGSGSELYKGLGSVVVGGLVFATLFTLIVVPVLFSIVVDAKSAWYKLMGWEMAETMDASKAEHLLEV